MTKWVLYTSIFCGWAFGIHPVILLPARQASAFSFFRSFPYIDLVISAVREQNPRMQHTPTSLQIAASVRLPVSELRFRTSRSSGPGGQNVNKLETRVELLFDVANSRSFSAEQRERILLNLASRIDGEGVLHISSQRSRSQWENKQVTIEKLVSLLREALKVRKKRIKTAPTRSSNETRVKQKKKHSQKKKLRKVHPSDE